MRGAVMHCPREVRVDAREAPQANRHAAPPVTAALREAPHARYALALSSLAFFLITVDILIINLALPAIADELGGGTTAQQWVIDGYTVMFAALLLSAGSLSDRVGAKRSLGWGITLFLLTSTACALAPTTGVLIAARFAQGAAAAAILPATMSLIREGFPDPRRRARALGVWAVGGAAAGAIGPLLGGLLTMLDWRLVFAINLPVCAGMLLLLRHVTPSPHRPAPLDWPGQALAVLTLSVLTYGLIRGGSLGFSEPSVILALAGAGGGLIAFTIVQARSRHPMMPLDLFRSRGMQIALAAGFAFIAGWFGTVFLVSLFLQQHLGLSPLHAGLVFLPAALASMAGNLLSGAIRNRYGPRVPVICGLLAMVMGLLALLLTTPLGSPLVTSVLLLLIGPGGSVAMPAATGLVLDSAVPAQAGIASGVFNTFRQIGGAVAIAVFGGVLTNASTFVSGMQISLAVAASLLLLTALLGLRIPAHPAARAPI